MELKSDCTAKETVNWVKKQNGRKVFAISDGGLIFRKYKELNKKANNPISK